MLGLSPRTDAQRADAVCDVMILYSAQCDARADCGADAECAQERLRALAPTPSPCGSEGAPRRVAARSRGGRSLRLFMRSCARAALAALRGDLDDSPALVWASTPWLVEQTMDFRCGLCQAWPAPRRGARAGAAGGSRASCGQSPGRATTSPTAWPCSSSARSALRSARSQTTWRLSGAPQTSAPSAVAGESMLVCCRQVRSTGGRRSVG